MNQNIWNSLLHSVDISQHRVDILPVWQVIADLEKKYAANAMALAMLGAIAKKVQEVPLWVQNTVAELLRANLDSKIANTGLMTAAIMAMNPKNIILATTASHAGIPKFPEAANDEKFRLAA
jgi:hypothetical protein